MHLEIFVLGQFKLKVDQQNVELPSRPAQSLLAYLILNAGATLRREKLASLLWCEASEGNSRGYLRQALWRIRKCLESGSLHWEDYLTSDDISVTFNNQSNYWLDADQLLRPVGPLSIEEIISDLELYRGEFLPGFYDEWVGLERDRLQAAYCQKIGTLLDRLIDDSRWDEVVKWGEHWIKNGYSVEPAYRSLMKAHSALGNKGMVGITYKRCCDALIRDLGVDPSPETVQLFEQLQIGQPKQRASNPSSHIRSRQPKFITDAGPQVDKPVVVARERELEKLRQILDQVMARNGRIVFVTGEAGSGKTTLVTEFANRSQDYHKDLIVAGGNCNAHTGVGDPYHPFREILELLTGDVEARWSAGAISRDRARIIWNMIPFTLQTLVDAGPDLVDTFISGQSLLDRASSFATDNSDSFARLEDILRLNKGDPIVRNQLQSDLFVQYSRVLQILSSRLPLILILDDLQWADVGSISLLFHLGRSLAGSRILIVGIFRPEEIAMGRAGQRHPLEPVVNELQRLYGNVEVNVDQIEGYVYIDELLDSEPNRISSQFREMLYGLTRGHPLFTIEVLRGMQERGDILKDEHGLWVEGPALDWEKLPARVEAVIAERIARMDPELQATLRIASIEGETFTAEVVAKILARPKAEILNQLSCELERKHRIVRAHSIQRINGMFLSSYRFCHFLVQKYLYNSMDEIERVYLHEEVGTVLKEIYAHQVESGVITPKLAYHFLEARNTEKAIYYLHQSGLRAMVMSAYQEAIVHLKKGLTVLAESQSPDLYAQLELLLTLDLSTALHHAKGSVDVEADRTALRALDLCEKVGNVSQLCKILATLSVYNYVKGENKLALGYTKRLLKLGEELQDSILVGVANWCLGIIYFVMGKYLLSRRHLEKSVLSYDSKEHYLPYVLLRGIDVGMSAMAYLACCLWALGYPDQAMKLSKEASRMMNDIDHAFTLADVLRYGICELHKQRRDGQALEEGAKELIRLSEDKYFSGWLATGKYCLGEAYILDGHYEKGISLIEDGVAREFSFGTKVGIPGPLCYLVEGYTRLGNFDQGLKVCNESLELIQKTDQHQWEPEHYRILAKLHLLRGDEGGAEKALLKAIDLAHEMDGKSWELRAAIDIAHLWQSQGKAEEGRQLVKELYSWFTEGFETPDLQEARKICDGF